MQAGRGPHACRPRPQSRLFDLRPLQDRMGRRAHMPGTRRTAPDRSENPRELRQGARDSWVGVFGAGLIYRVFLEFAIERPLPDPERLSRLAAIAVRLTQRGVDRRALHIRHRHTGFINDRGWGLRSRGERIDTGLDLPSPKPRIPSPNFDHLHALRRPFFDAPPHLLDLHFQLDQSPENEFELLAGDVAGGRRGDAHRQRARALPDVAGDIAGADLALGREHDHRLDEGSELAHVAWPVGVDEDLQRPGWDAVEVAVVLL